jgi:hypothetical protein
MGASVGNRACAKRALLRRGRPLSDRLLGTGVPRPYKVILHYLWRPRSLSGLRLVIKSEHNLSCSAFDRKNSTANRRLPQAPKQVQYLYHLHPLRSIQVIRRLQLSHQM